MKRLLLLLSLAVAATGTAFADECDSADFFIKQQKYRSALTIVEPLAAKGIPCGQYYLGLLYVDGLGVKRDEKKGLALIKKADKAGYEKTKHFYATYH